MLHRNIQSGTLTGNTSSNLFFQWAWNTLLSAACGIPSFTRRATCATAETTERQDLTMLTVSINACEHQRADITFVCLCLFGLSVRWNYDSHVHTEAARALTVAQKSTMVCDTQCAHTAIRVSASMLLTRIDTVTVTVSLSPSWFCNWLYPVFKWSITCLGIGTADGGSGPRSAYWRLLQNPRILRGPKTQLWC